MTPKRKPLRFRSNTFLSSRQTNGFEHDSVPDAMAFVYKMGHDTRLWETTLRTDTENLTKKDLKKGNFKNLNYFDAIVFASTTGELDMTDDQKADMMSFIKEDGKGFVGIHAALDTNYKWPEYGEMIGGWFDQHPWGTFNAPIILEDPTFPAVRHFPAEFMKKDEIYQAKEWSRDKVNVSASPRREETQLRQPPRPSPGSRLRRGLVQDVRQGPRLLLNSRSHQGSLGRSRHSEDVL